MKQVGVPPSVSFLNVFIKALCMKKETMDDALRVFRGIPDHGCIPDSYTYQKISEAKELFEEMDAKDCSPTVVTYTSLIHGLCLSIILNEAMELFEEMSRKGIEPNMVTFSSLMDGLCKGGCSLHALKLREKMVGKRFSANTIIYNNLVNGLRKEGKVPDAVQILDKIKLQGLKPDGVLYGMLVNSLCNYSMFQEVANLLDEMVPGRMLPIHTYKYLVGCFSKKGDVYKASQIVNEMLLEGSIPDKWNSVVYGFLHRTKEKEAADVVYVELIDNFLETRPIPTGNDVRSSLVCSDDVSKGEERKSGVLGDALQERATESKTDDIGEKAKTCTKSGGKETMKGMLFHAEETSVFNMKEQVFTKSLNARSRAILMEMLDQSGGASSLTLSTLPILGLTLLGLALDPSLVGLPATSQSIPVLIVPERFYSVIVDELIREEVYLFVENRTLSDISTGEVEAWLKIFTIIQ
ncbi:hypothetical protein GIB67_028663 [Kingdonia uniflora]|uniref:Pentatricopeptide repeat-containing protein n=1 Tax=Kingdonia uniflora TaxID=39325 RepID=A0A7J7L1M7_9MAGN|nr:hypothetical protein GIB67_028663 [Kingdonia uniflora]